MKTLEERYELAMQAVTHCLNRIQTDPNFGYYAGDMTETFNLLTQTEAAHRDMPQERVRDMRLVDLQPPYDKRCADIVRYKRYNSKARDFLTVEQCEECERYVQEEIQ